MVEWGSYPAVTSKTAIPVEQAAVYQRREGIYEMHYINYSDPLHLVPANIPDPNAFIDKTVRELVANGAEPIYIGVAGASATVVYRGIGTPPVWAVLLVIVGIAVLLGLAYLVLVTFYQLTTLEIPGVGKIPLFPIIILIGVVAIAYVLIRRPAAAERIISIPEKVTGAVRARER